MKSPRAQVLDLMVEIHLLPYEVALFLVLQMDDLEIARRFCMYTGMELSADRCWKPKGVNVSSWQAVHAPNDDGRLSALNSASVESAVMR